MSTPYPYSAILLNNKLNNNLLVKDSSDYINSLSLLSLTYTNFITGKLDNPILSDLRNSILTRNDSLSFHFNLIREYGPIEQGILNPVQIHQAITEKSYLFDSFVFNMVSAIDYSASLTYFLLTHHQDYKKTWKKLYKILGASEIFDTSDVKQYIYRQHVWINKLIEYRADLIHYKIDKSSSTVSLHYNLNQTSLEIQPPVNFERHFREIQEIASTNKDIDKISFWLLLNYRKSFLELTKLLIEVIKKNKKGDYNVISSAG